MWVAQPSPSDSDAAKVQGACVGARRPAECYAVWQQPRPRPARHASVSANLPSGPMSDWVTAHQNGPSAECTVSVGSLTTDSQNNVLALSLWQTSPRAMSIF